MSKLMGMAVAVLSKVGVGATHVKISQSVGSRSTSAQNPTIKVQRMTSFFKALRKAIVAFGRAITAARGVVRGLTQLITAVAALLAALHLLGYGAAPQPSDHHSTLSAHGRQVIDQRRTPSPNS